MLDKMIDITLTDKQAAAVKDCVDWFRNRTKTQKIYRIFGFAGCGKSTILKFILDELGATIMPRIEKKKGFEIEDRHFDDYDFDHDGEPHERKQIKVLCAAFSGKASLVMTRKGTPASTIHSMTYKVIEPTEAAIETAKTLLEKLRLAGAPKDTGAALLWRAQIRDREMQIKNLHRPSFVINPQSPILDADLIVLDEVSMVGDDMAADLMSFGKPILVLGDPGQLPPIKGEGAFTQAKPDILLTEIHRQAEDSAIIRLATMAREGRLIPFGVHSDLVHKIKRSQAPLEWMMKADQIICGYNASRFMINNAVRRHRGFPIDTPVSDDKIMCLKNMSANGLINGCFLTLSDIQPMKEFGFSAQIKTEDGNEIGEHVIYRGHFDDHVEFDKDRNQRDYWKRKGLVECTYGDAITCHKAQGSQFSNVFLYDDGFGRGEDRAKWLYTAVTRAESGLIIAA